MEILRLPVLVKCHGNNMNSFKDSRGVWLTNALFEETAVTTKEYVKMSLAEAKEQYLAFKDPTGYEFSKEVLGGWQHWKAIKESVVLAPIIAEWEEELEVYLRATALKEIGSLSREGHFQASKFLMDRGWDTRKAGRPSKEEVTRETRVQAKMKDEWNKDIIRIKR